MTDAELRRKRLKNYLVTELGGVEAELARKIDRSPSQTSDVLAGRKSFGARFARHCEKRLGLPRLYLDQDDNHPILLAREITFLNNVRMLPAPQRAEYERRIAGLVIAFGEPVEDERIERGRLIEGTAHRERVKRSETDRRREKERRGNVLKRKDNGPAN